MIEVGQPVDCRCGSQHLREGKKTCSGHTNGPDGAGPVLPCRRWATKGHQVCNAHGARSPQAKAAAARRLAEAEVISAVATYGERRAVNPVQMMVEILHDAAGHLAWLRDKIAAEDPDALVWGITDELTKGGGEFPGVDVRRSAAPSVWLTRYDIERRVAMDASEKLARLGMDWDAREAVRREGAALTRVCREFARLLGHDPNAPGVVSAFRGALKAVLGADGVQVIEGKAV